MVALSMTQWPCTCVSSPMCESRTTQFGPMRTRLPSVTLPSNTTFTSMNTSVAVRERAAHVHTRGVRQRSAREHELPRSLVGTAQGFRLGELHLVVHAQHFGERSAR